MLLHSRLLRLVWVKTAIKLFPETLELTFRSADRLSRLMKEINVAYGMFYGCFDGMKSLILCSVFVIISSLIN